MRLFEFMDSSEPVVESNYKILTPLTAMAKEILSQVDKGLKPDEELVLKPKFSDNVRSEIDEYGPIFEILCDYIERNIPIVFSNKDSGSLKGAYSHAANVKSSKMDDVFIYVGTILGEIKPYAVNDVKSKKIETVLVHELRHVMQRRQFGDFYHKQVDKMAANQYNYHSDPIEIDAAFLHHLHDEEATDIQSFVKGVMDRFTKYKKLTPKQVEHYRRKAATYFYTSISPKDKPQTTAKDRLASQKTERLENAMQQLRDMDVEKLGDLRNVGSNDSGRFKINPFQFRQVLLSAVRNEIENKLNVALGIGFLGFMKQMNPEIDTDTLLNNMNISLDELIQIAENSEFQGFDKELFINSMKSLKDE